MIDDLEETRYMFLGIFSNNRCDSNEIIDFSRERKSLEINTEWSSFFITYDDSVYTVKTKNCFIAVDGFLISNYNGNKFNFADTVLDLYQNFGQECFLHITGKYSIVIFDLLKKEVLIGIDRFGKKKIAYSKNNNTLVFGNNAKEVSLISKNSSIDETALGRFFTYNYICAPYTIFKNVYKVRPGHFIKIAIGIVSEHEYWNPTMEPTNGGESDYERCTIETIRASLDSKINMISCMKPALFLSGGIDSTLLCKIMSMGDYNVTAYTAQFAGGLGEEDESEYAKAISKYYGVPHEIIRINPEQIKERIEGILESTDEPMANKTYATAKILMNVAKEKCDCVVTGDGGDELFFGYPQYQRLSQAQRVHKGLYYLNRVVPDSIIKKIVPEKAYSILYNCKHFPPEQLFSYNAAMISEETVKNCRQDLSYLIPESLKNKSWYERKNYVDLVYGTQAALRKWNDNSDDVGIIHISPILSEEVVRISKSIPKKLLLNKDCNKIILRSIVENDMPSISKLPKHGFDVPVVQWLRTSFIERFNYFTSKEYVIRQGLFNFESISEIKKSFDNNLISYKNNADTFLWDYYVFQCWYSNILG